MNIEELDHIYFGSERRPRRCFRLYQHTYDGNQVKIPGYFRKKQLLGIDIGDIVEILRVRQENRLCKIVQFEPDVRVVEISYYGVKIVKYESDEHFIEDSQRRLEEMESGLQQQITSYIGISRKCTQ